MAMTAQDYKFYKSLNPSELTDQDRKDLIDFERAEAKAPSLDDVQWARDIDKMASKNPSTVGRELKESGDYERAQQILNADRAYAATLGPRKMDAYVRKVQRIPDDLIEGNDFKFNWKSAYENLKGEKLRDTEADYDKLQKFIQSNMYDVADPVNFREIAYNLHMFNPNTMSWTDFINSEQGTEFKNYLKDAEKYQRDKRINEIFDKESNFLVDFGLPVAKENARSALLKGEEPELGVPLLFDAATNAAMFVGGKPGLVMAPTISNVGQAVSNDMEPGVAAVNSVLGAGVNAVTPFMMSRGGRYFKTPGKNYSQKVAVQDRANVLASQVADTEKKIQSGALHTLPAKTPNSEGIRETLGYINEPKKILYTDDATRVVKEYGLDGYKIMPLAKARQHEAGILTDAEMKNYWANRDLARNNWIEGGLKDVKGARKVSQDREARRQKLAKQMTLNNSPEITFKGVKKPGPAKPNVTKILDDITKGKKISEMNMKELYALGYTPKESVTSFLWRIAPDAIRNYFTNFMGRNVPAGATMRLPNMLFGTDLNKLVKDKKSEKPKISEIFGGE